MKRSSQYNESNNNDDIKCARNYNGKKNKTKKSPNYVIVNDVGAVGVENLVATRYTLLLTPDYRDCNRCESVA